MVHPIQVARRLVPVILLVGGALVGLALGQGSQPQPPPGFAYDPEKHEGPHAEADFEWWYHFGFLRPKGATQPAYSFVSSFQRNKKGRYLFYNLADLTTGQSLHRAMVERAMLGAAEPAEGLFSGLGGLLGSGSPTLPVGHEWMPPPDPNAEPARSELWLLYGKNRFLKKDASYRLVYDHPGFVLDLSLARNGPPMPVLGTGLTGLERPEDQHYYSFPRMSATGRLEREGVKTEVEGDVWYDHQWGKVSTTTLMKWCWWGLRLDNGENLSIFRLQDAITGRTVQRGVTRHFADGRTEVARDATFSSDGPWKSPRGRRYFLQWSIRSPSLGLTIETRPYTDDHELPALLYGQIWEGPCKVAVRYADGRRTAGLGFQELIGQDHD